MAVQRRVNWISQQRVDVPDMRAVESAASNDMDQLIQAFVTGTSQGYFLRGFEISMAGAIGGAASALQMIVDPGAILHITSSVSGTVLMVPVGTPTQQINAATNTIVDGAFTPNAINYVSVEYERFIDDTTSSQVYIWNPTTKNETTKNAPRAQILRYRIKVSTSTPPTNYLPVSTVATDAGNNVVSITDSRWGLFRLGTGGASPNPFYIYPWTAQTEGRTESPSTSTSNSVNPFRGGDKMLGTLKDWMNAVMTSIQEIKGTTYWYSISSSGSIQSLREDLGNTVITGRGSIAHGVLPATPTVATQAGQINWDQDINIRVIGSRLAYTLTANPTSTNILLTDDQVAYITLIRNVEVSPNLIFTQGSATITSVGSISWTSPLAPGDWIKLGSDTDSQYYKIQTVDSLTQVTLTENYTGTSTGPIGAKAKYAFGSYQTASVPSTTRHVYIAARKDVPEGQDVFWLFLRSDNGGAQPKVYIRFLGVELDQGEDRDVSDVTSKELLMYIGSPFETAYLPGYASAFFPGSLPQKTNITNAIATNITGGQYFLINSAGNWRKYYVWFKKSGVGTDPVPPNTDFGIEVDILNADTAAQVAAKLVLALNPLTPNGTSSFDFIATQDGITTNLVHVTNTSGGATVSASNFNVGAPFAIAIAQTGTGTGNLAIRDGDNLTLAMKELDIAISNIVTLLNEPSYDETIDIVASGATPPTSLTGPISTGTVITLPNNSRMGALPQKYTVGKGGLQVFLNGQYLRLGVDWLEVGVALSNSATFQIQRGLVVGDVLEVRIGVTGGPGGGAGGAGPAGPTGPAGPAGADAIGGPVAISTKSANYTVVNSDNVLLANATGGAITFTLPTAAAGVGQVFFFKKIDSSANAMTIKGNGSELIDATNTQSTTVQYETFTVVSNGTQWWII